MVTFFIYFRGEVQMPGGHLLIFLGFLLLLPQEVLLLLVEVDDLFGLEGLSFEGDSLVLEKGALSIGYQEIGVAVFGGFLTVLPVHFPGQYIPERALHDSIGVVLFIFVAACRDKYLTCLRMYSLSGWMKNSL
jgi:hypothetical protein